MRQMIENGSLHRDCRDGNRPPPHHSGYDPKHETTQSAQPGTETFFQPASFKFRLENCPMPLFMGHEFPQLITVGRAGQARSEYLTAINIDGPMLTRVNDFEYLFRISPSASFAGQFFTHC